MAYMGEHSMVDGMPTMRLCDRLVEGKYEIIASKSKVSDEIPSVYNIFDDAIDFIGHNSELDDAINIAKRDFRALVDCNEMTIKVFNEYGSRFMKGASFSPDALMQMAIQLASYRLFDKQVAVYESSQVRYFLHGRTETTRSVSPESKSFIEKMGMEPDWDPDEQSVNDKLDLLKKAMWIHSKYLNKASKGQGCDRHLFGLSMCLDDEEEPPALFSDPVFQRSRHWHISSSTCPHVPGFGCVVDDGIGMGYNVNPTNIEFIVAGRKKSNVVERFAGLLDDALKELKVLIDRSGEIETQDEGIEV